MVIRHGDEPRGCDAIQPETAGPSGWPRRGFRGLFAMACASLALVALSAVARAQAPVTLYCSILEEQCREGALLFEKASGIKVQMVRKSTGETYATIKAESANPKGDVWWGGPGDAHLQAAEEGLTEEYRSPLLDKLQDWARRHAEMSKYKTVGTYLGVLGFGVNTEILKSKNLPEPKCWADLADPKFRDEVQMADPNSSGTAYTFLATMVQLMGEDKGFEYMKALHRNISQYTKSGIAPVNALRLGETAVGIAFLHDIITQKLAGAPVKAIAPCEGTGYETGSASVIKGGKNPEGARKFMDWALGVEAQAINNKLKIYSMPSNRDVPRPDDAPDFSAIKLIDYDTAKYGASAERVRLLKKWGDQVKNLPR